MILFFEASHLEPDAKAAGYKAQKKRPGAVAALLGVEIILGIFSFFGGFVHVFLGIGSIINFNGSSMTGGAADDLGGVLIAMGILFSAAGVVTWTRKA